MVRKSKILVLTHRMPWPPDRGTAIRTFHIIKHLAKEFELELLSFSDKPGPPDRELQHLFTRIDVVPINYRWAKFWAGIGILLGSSGSLRSFDSPDYFRLFQQRLRDFKPDFVWVDSSAMSLYPEKIGIPYFADFMDVDCYKWAEFSKRVLWPLSQIYKMESKRLAEFEKKVAQSAKVIFVVSQEEKRKLALLAPGAKIVIIPNGVDQSYFKPGNAAIIPGRLVFTGVMDYYPNIDAVCWFCDEVWPIIKRKVPSATLYIVGTNPVSKVKRLERHDGVHVTGYVPDVRSFIAEAQICVIPIRFAIGLQNKVIEAMAMGKAIVASPGVIAGLPEDPGEALQVAENAVTFTNSIWQIMSDTSFRERLETNAIKFVERYHRWDENLKVLTQTMFVETTLMNT